MFLMLECWTNIWIPYSGIIKLWVFQIFSPSIERVPGHPIGGARWLVIKAGRHVGRDKWAGRHTFAEMSRITMCYKWNSYVLIWTRCDNWYTKVPKYKPKSHINIQFHETLLLNMFKRSVRENEKKSSIDLWKIETAISSFNSAHIFNKRDSFIMNMA